MRSSLFVHRVHRFNLPLVLFFSLFKRVRYWKSELSDISVRFPQLEWLDPEKLSDLDSWNSAQQGAYEKWSVLVLKVRDRLVGQARGVARGVEQRVALAFEAEILFEHLVSQCVEADATAIILQTAWGQFFRKIGYRSSLGGRGSSVRTSAASIPFEVASYWMRTAKSHAGQVWKCFARVSADGRNAVRENLERNAKILVSGISLTEYPRSDVHLDFSFLVSNHHLLAEDVLYLLPRAPDLVTQQFLAKGGVRWLDASTYRGILNGTECIFAAAHVLFSAVFKAARWTHLFYSEIDQITSCTAPWRLIWQRYRPAIYLYSVSVSIPEPSEASAFDGFGVANVLWFYSANCFPLRKHSSSSLAKRVHWSNPVAQTIFGWNEEFGALVRNRLLVAGTIPKIVALGPIMCGDSRDLQLDGQQSRRKIGIVPSGEGATGDYFLSVFDVSPVRAQIRESVGLGPDVYSFEFCDFFYRDLKLLLERNPRIRLIIKRKRSDPRNLRPIVGGLAQLIADDGPWRRSNRVIQIDPEISPYLATSVLGGITRTIC